MSEPSLIAPFATRDGAASGVPDAALHGAVLLRDWGVIRASGPDAAGFLQGQLTQDVTSLGAGQARLAGYCSAKGRLLASFVVWQDAAGDLLLACSADLLAAALKRLSMFVLRAKCKLTDATAQVPLWGVAGSAAALVGEAAQRGARPWACLGASGEGGRAIRLPDAHVGEGAVPRWLWAPAAGAAAPALPALDADAWRWLEVKSGTARIVLATAEQFVPQMVNLELVGGVSFQKGCYPGQEVVARSQYRGTLKRRAYVLTSTQVLQPGQEIFDEADPQQPAGMVVLGGSLGARHAALAELKIATAESGKLHLGSASGPLLALDIQPYALPAAA